jgi:hypothetical protein
MRTGGEAGTPGQLASPPVPLRVVLIGGVVLILAGLAVVLSHSGREQTGTNAIKRDSFVVVVPAGGTACQVDALPAGTGHLELLIGTYGKPGPPVTATLQDGPRRLGTGRVAPGWHEGVIGIPLQHVAPASLAARLCLHSGGRVAIAGQRGGPPAQLTRLNGKPQDARISIRYEEPNESSGWSRIGAFADRVGSAHGLGSWAFWAFIALVAAAATLAIVIVLRSARAGGEPT